ncbi:hypothetical protein DRQ33_06150, partial [bacterium]
MSLIIIFLIALFTSIFAQSPSDTLKVIPNNKIADWNENILGTNAYGVNTIPSWFNNKPDDRFRIGYGMWRIPDTLYNARTTNFPFKWSIWGSDSLQYYDFGRIDSAYLGKMTDIGLKILRSHGYYWKQNIGPMRWHDADDSLYCDTCLLDVIIGSDTLKLPPRFAEFGLVQMHKVVDSLDGSMVFTYNAITDSAFYNAHDEDSGCTNLDDLAEDISHFCQFCWGTSGPWAQLRQNEGYTSTLDRIKWIVLGNDWMNCEWHHARVPSLMPPDSADSTIRWWNSLTTDRKEAYWMQKALEIAIDTIRSYRSSSQTKIGIHLEPSVAKEFGWIINLQGDSIYTTIGNSPYMQYEVIFDSLCPDDTCRRCIDFGGMFMNFTVDDRPIVGRTTNYFKTTKPDSTTTTYKFNTWDTDSTPAMFMGSTLDSAFIEMADTSDTAVCKRTVMKPYLMHSIVNTPNDHHNYRYLEDTLFEFYDSCGYLPKIKSIGVMEWTHDGLKNHVPNYIRKCLYDGFLYYYDVSQLSMLNTFSLLHKYLEYQFKHDGSTIPLEFGINLIQEHLLRGWRQDIWQTGTSSCDGSTIRYNHNSLHDGTNSYFGDTSIVQYPIASLYEIFSNLGDRIVESDTSDISTFTIPEFGVWDGSVEILANWCGEAHFNDTITWEGDTTIIDTTIIITETHTSRHSWGFNFKILSDDPERRERYLNGHNVWSDPFYFDFDSLISYSIDTDGWGSGTAIDTIDTGGTFSLLEVVPSVNDSGAVKIAILNRDLDSVYNFAISITGPVFENIVYDSIGARAYVVDTAKWFDWLSSSIRQDNGDLQRLHPVFASNAASYKPTSICTTEWREIIIKDSLLSTDYLG